MKRRAYLLALSLIIGPALLLLVASMAGGCGYNGYVDGPVGWTCEHPITGRKDDYGNQDECCSKKPCCPNPNPKHFVLDWPNIDPFPDPCCIAESCLPEWNPWQVPDAGAPCDAGTVGGDAGADATTGACNDDCQGECAPRAPAGFTEPMLVWMGPAGQEPPCPEATPHEAYHGFAELEAKEISCPACACDAPKGTCALPKKITASSGTCTAPSAAHLDFDPPTGWEGSCTTQGAITADAKCNGGPCAQSLTIEPLRLSEEPCTPRALVPKVHAREKPSSAVFKTAAIACQPDSAQPCAGGLGACLPSTEAPLGFESCILAVGEVQCPETYPHPHVFYSGFTDTRGCSECTCGPPEGGGCSSLLTVYQDSACKGSVLVGISLEAREFSFCADIPGNLALGSKIASAPKYAPGSCAPHGGVAFGAVATTGTATLCCRQN